MRKIKASSLVEVIVASVIISITFTLFLMSFLNINASTYTLRKHIIRNKMDKLMNTLKVETIQVDESVNIELNGVEFRKTIRNYKDVPSLYKVDIIAFDKVNNIKISRKELIYQP